MAEAASLVSGWAWLPSHLLDSILEKLIPMSDYIRVGAVCKHWQSVASHHKQQRLKSRHKQVPMLMIPSKEMNNDERRALYSVTQGKAYMFELDVPYNERCCGSSHGWLAYTDENLVITLLNPFTGRTIGLPPLPGVPLEVFRYDYHILKVELSADPFLFPNGYQAMVIYGHSLQKIAHLWSGDDAWTNITLRDIGFEDVIYYKGHFLVHSFNGLVYSINVSRDSNTKPCISRVGRQYSIGRGYLVESSGGDLLLIRKFELMDFKFHRMNMNFKVFKLDFACGDQPEGIEEIESIGNDALFLGEIESMCVDASDFPRCNPNCIYFSTSDEGLRPLDMAAFYLENRRTEPHCYRFGLLQKMRPPSIWILPTIV